MLHALLNVLVQLAVWCPLARWQPTGPTAYQLAFALPLTALALSLMTISTPAMLVMTILLPVLCPSRLASTRVHAGHHPAPGRPVLEAD